MGTALSDDELQRLLDFAEYEKAELEASKTPALFTPEELAEQAIEHRRQYAAKKQNSRQGGKLLCVDLAKLREESRITIGIHEIFGKVYDEIGFDKLFGARKKSAKRYIRHITLARLANPASKRRSVADLSDDFGISLSLDSVYRMMDNIDEQIIAKGQQLAHTATKNLLGSDVSLLFYDCTTLYFESFTEDDLKKNGYSKDMKFNQPQVVLGLLATTEGLPVGYELFPGNQFEGHTLQTIIPKIKDKYHLKQVIFTADSAMLSRKNMEYLRENQVEYIVGARLKNLNKSWAAKVTDPKTSTQKIRSFDYENGQRLIVTYSDKLARKNQHDRDKAIEKLRKKLEKSSDPSSLISN